LILGRAAVLGLQVPMLFASASTSKHAHCDEQDVDQQLYSVRIEHGSNFVRTRRPSDKIRDPSGLLTKERARALQES
jgi:hypothetical protein